MRRGRRPLPGGELQINPQARQVQDSVDDAALTLLDALKDAIRKRIAAGDLDTLRLTTLTKELRGLLIAIRKPNSTLMYMHAPAVPQMPSAERAERDRHLEAGVTENPQLYRQAQEGHLAGGGG